MEWKLYQCCQCCSLIPAILMNMLSAQCATNLITDVRSKSSNVGSIAPPTLKHLCRPGRQGAFLSKCLRGCSKRVSFAAPNLEGIEMCLLDVVARAPPSLSAPGPGEKVRVPTYWNVMNPLAQQLRPCSSPPRASFARDHVTTRPGFLRCGQLLFLLARTIPAQDTDSTLPCLILNGAQR